MHHFESPPSRHAKPKNAIAARNSAPLTKQAAKPLYETDFYVWAREHAALLRAGRYEELDLQNLIEEVDDLGISLYQSVRSRVRTIIEHLLKLEHSHAREPRDLWRDTIAVQRADLEDDLTASLRARIEAELPKQYERARTAAARVLRRHGEDAAADALPEARPYTLDQIVGEWRPDDGA
jgi:hypothetical protein